MLSLAKQFPPSIRYSSAYVQEMVAFVEAIKKWRHYLVCVTFTIVIYHDSLIFFLTQQVQTSEQQKYLCHLLCYKYKIIYRLGKKNTVVVSLSRREDPTHPLISDSPQTPSSDMSSLWSSWESQHCGKIRHWVPTHNGHCPHWTDPSSKFHLSMQSCDDAIIVLSCDEIR